MSDSKGQFSKEGIALPGEAEDKCCWCIPIKIGIYIIGVCMCLWAVNLILVGLRYMDASAMWGILYVAAAAPIVAGAYFYVLFFMKPEDAERKAGVVKACMLVILSCIASAAIAVVQYFIYFLPNNYPGAFGYTLSSCISSACVALVYFYYAGVGKRYAA